MTRELLKFCGPTEYALGNLREGVIFCQHFSAYNDPFEFWTNLKSGIPDAVSEPDRFLAAATTWGFDFRSVEEAMECPYFSESFETYFEECQLYAPPFEEMREDVRIACFGSERDNLLMWSHYADGLRGFCIVFDEEAVAQSEPEGYVVDVSYLDAPPVVDGFLYGIAWDQDWYSHVAIRETKAEIDYGGKPERAADIEMYEEMGVEGLRRMREIWQQVFAVKPSEWKYENERRLLVQTIGAQLAPILRPYRDGAIKELIIGERMPTAYRERLLEVVKKKMPNIQIRLARRSPSIFTLTVE